MEAVPTPGKPEQVLTQEMFNRIARHYDLLNHILSFGRDRYWRKILINKVINCHPSSILDLASGTGDLSVSAALKTQAHITAVDISENMLILAQQKAQKQNLQQRIRFVAADALHLPFDNNSFDVVTISFGIRNFQNVSLGLKEIQRVLKPEGHLFILEFGQPENAIFRFFYNLYSLTVIPVMGKIFSGNAKAYSYLRKSIRQFPYGNSFSVILQSEGFTHESFQALSGGIVFLYSAQK